MTDDQWGTSPQGEKDAAARAAERLAAFEAKLDKQLEQKLGLQPMTAEQKAKASRGVNLEKDPVTRQLYTSHQPYDSAARREAIQKHLERQGISQELQSVRAILELGQGAAPGVVERRDPHSRGAQMRGRDERGKEGPTRER